MFDEQRNSANSGVDGEMDAELAQALGDFRSWVRSWSDAKFARPRAIALVEHRRAWRRAAAWALGGVLAAGSLSAGMYEYQHHNRLARVAAERQATERQVQRELAARQSAEQDEKLMAAVDQDVSQEVPSAMEPLAQLMNDSGK